jgi:hypothetical protein
MQHQKSQPAVINLIAVAKLDPPAATEAHAAASHFRKNKPRQRASLFEWMDRRARPDHPGQNRSQQASADSPRGEIYKSIGARRAAK